MISDTIIERLGGSAVVARLCECTPQAVSQWFGTDPDTGEQRQIPNARLLYLKAIRPDAFQEASPQNKAVPRSSASA